MIPEFISTETNTLICFLYLLNGYIDLFFENKLLHK